MRCMSPAGSPTKLPSSQDISMREMLSRFKYWRLRRACHRDQQSAADRPNDRERKISQRAPPCPGARTRFASPAFRSENEVSQARRPPRGRTFSQNGAETPAAAGGPEKARESSGRTASGKIPAIADQFVSTETSLPSSLPIFAEQANACRATRSRLIITTYREPWCEP